MIEDLTFLEEGEYTARTDLVRSVAEELKESTRTPWGVVSGYVVGLRHDNSDKGNIFRKRTASEILESGYVTGCTDTALAFIVLARELGIPTRYVETFDADWLQDTNANGIQGHIFVDVLADGQWRAYEPKKGFTKDNNYTMNGRRYVEVGKGLDFSGVYIKENGVYRPQPTNLQSLDEAIRVFKPQTPSAN
jgi:transglutaminase-like putative cysteine protease